jgi:hypothetical protein
MTSNPSTLLQLKTLSKDAIPRAMEKADRYRLLNEPLQAQSICLDILAADPENQPALVTLLLAMTDQFGPAYKIAEMEPKQVIARLKSEYDRVYYTGIVAERRAEAILDENTSDGRYLAHDYLTTAMQHYEAAARLRPAGNDDALLRWNTCARLMNSEGVQARSEEVEEPFLE